MSQNLSYTEQNINDELANLQLTNDALDLDESLFPYVIFKIHGNVYALNCKYVQSIEETPEDTTEVSQSSYEIRGVSYYKDQAINLIDLRRVLGIISQKDYLTNVVDIPSRIQEHISFVERLEEQLTTESPITVTEDPHECNLGKWIDAYKPLSATIKNEIEHIVAPHDLLHNTVKRIKDALNMNRKEEALDIFDKIKNNYSQNVIGKLNNLEKTLFSEIKEYSIIIRVGTKTVGLIVDETESVEPIDKIQRLPEFVIVTEYIQNLGLRNKDDSLLLILEPSAFA